MNKMKRNEKKERGRGGREGERRENIEERSQHFSVGWGGRRRKRELKGTVRFRSVIRPVASEERKNEYRD